MSNSKQKSKGNNVTDGELNEDGLIPGAELSSAELLKVLAEQREKANKYESAKEDDAS